MKPKLIDKKVKKLKNRKCLFCEIDKYELLNVHRLIPGEQDGRYTEYNTICCCCLCHTKIHVGLLKIIGKYSTGYDYVLNYIDEEGVERIKPC